MAFYFRLPSYGDLTSEQRTLLLESGPLAIGGGPGTGKSVVSLWRHIMNYAQGRRNSLLLTYTKSLEYYLKASAATENKEAAENIGRIYWWTYHGANALDQPLDEIIVDEAQDVELEKHEIIKNNCHSVSYTADNHQILYASKSTSQENLAILFNDNISFRLSRNFRNSKNVSRFIRSVLPDRLISEGEDDGNFPVLVCSDNNHEIQQQVAIDIIDRYRSSTHNIVILHPTTGLVDMWHDILINRGIPASKYKHTDDYVGVIDNVHICTYKSAKGLEFDTVIMPDMNCYDYNLNRMDIIDENDYYVAFTRARRNLFLLDNSALINGAVENNFLKTAIYNNLVNIDYSYVTEENETPKPKMNSDYSDSDEDDLPF